MILDDRKRAIILEMAEQNMNTAAVARKMYFHRNAAVYHFDKIQDITGLDPRNFYDLVKLVKMVKGAT
jgi:carbohydrate diacid regulator